VNDHPPSEVELKLEVPADAVERLRAHPLIAALDPPKRLESTYFDTPELDLRACALSLRLRSDGSEGTCRVQTVKTLGGAAGLFDRGEWETPVAGDLPDLDAAAPVKAALKGRVKRLKPLFAVKVERASGLVREGGSEIELSLDLGEVRTDAGSAPLKEVELELKRGRPTRLFELAERLFEAAPLRLSARSKAEAGYDLIQPRDAVKAEPVALERGLTTAAAFQKIGRACLVHYLRNERILRERRTTESLHQARVGVRRLRAAMTLFKDLLGDSQSATLKDQLRDLARRLGAARDLDVLIARIETLDLAAPVDLPALQAALQRRREAAYDEAARALGAPEAARLAFEVAAWLETGWWLTARDDLHSARRDLPMADFAAAELARRTRKLGKRAVTLARLDPSARHAVRKSAKKVRYGAEFFRSLAKTRRRAAADAFIDALKPLQDVMGELNDVAVAQQLLGALAADEPGPAGYAAGAAVEALSRETDRLLRQATKTAKAFAKAEGFL
jgi:inorganic triphosphatase YgiF